MFGLLEDYEELLLLKLLTEKEEQDESDVEEEQEESDVDEEQEESDVEQESNDGSLEEESEQDVPCSLEVADQLSVEVKNDSTVKVEIKEEPLEDENDLPTSDIHEEPILPIITGTEPEEMSEFERQSIQMFFDSMARTVMTLSPSFVSRIKSEVLRVVSDIEMEAYKEKIEQSKKPIRNPENDTAATRETEPQIKIETEDDEETDPLNGSQPSDPDLDSNYEPLTKKKKRSHDEQPTPALQVDRTPRIPHESVETFFRSIANIVTSFTPIFVSKARLEVLKLISELELEDLRSRRSDEVDDSVTRHGYLLAIGSDY